jgi:hypothetical protein
MGLRPPQGDEKTRLGSATALYGTVAHSFVIPSEAEGSAVRGPFVEMFFDRAYPDFLPRSTGQSRVCAFLSKERRMRSANATKVHRTSGVAKWRGAFTEHRGAESVQEALDALYQGTTLVGP